MNEENKTMRKLNSLLSKIFEELEAQKNIVFYNQILYLSSKKIIYVLVIKCMYFKIILYFKL